MTKKQKDMLKRILVTAVLYVALVAADHMKMVPAVFTGWKMLFLYLIPYFVIVFSDFAISFFVIGVSRPFINMKNYILNYAFKSSICQ